eukprot:456613-Prymnesium_polylepis.1
MCVYSTARGPAVSVARPGRMPRPRATSRRPVTHITHTVAESETNMAAAAARCGLTAPPGEEMAGSCPVPE